MESLEKNINVNTDTPEPSSLNHEESDALDLSVLGSDSTASPSLTEYPDVTSVTEVESLVVTEALAHEDSVGAEQPENVDAMDSLDMSSLVKKEPKVEEENEPEDPDTRYRRTMSRLKTGTIDSDRGIEELKSIAKDGHVGALMSLGQLYSDENNTLYNPALAFDCFLRASELENPDGYYNLGICYANGIGCAKDHSLAMESFAEGAKRYHPESICALGMCYEFGHGCEINYEYAVMLYEKGAELSNPEAINNLGGCYFYGHGVEQDKDKAISLYRRAASLGSSGAECRLGICRETGDGCECDPREAFEHYKRAAKANNEIALFHLAACYDRGIGVEQNFNQAFEYYERAAKLGYAPAKYETGKMYMAGRGTKKNPDAAYRMFSSAAKHGYTLAEYEVANCFFEGIGAVRNRGSAYEHYASAYDSAGERRADAAYRLGLCHLKGLGADEDAEEAFEWFKKGAELSSPEATYMLGECYHFGVGTEHDDLGAARAYLDAITRMEDQQCDESRFVPLMLALAECYENGIGIIKDHNKALALYKRAADLGDDEAMYRTGCAIVSGVGMRAEYPAARPYILRAARKGYLPAMLMIGVFSDDGRGVKKNKADARGWYQKAVSADNNPPSSLYEFPDRIAERKGLFTDAQIQAQYRLGMLIARYEPTAQGYIEAFEYIALAAAMGYESAQTEITKIYVSGGDLKSYYESPFSREDACFENGDDAPSRTDLAAAMNKLGDSFFDEKNLLKKNESAAAMCYKRAAELGQTEACYSYGWCLRHGVGVPENDAESIKWLKMAADRGNSNAAYSYGLCCEEGAGTGIKNKREALYYYRIAAASGHTDAAQRYVILSMRDE